MEKPHTDFFGPLPDDPERDLLSMIYHALAFISRATEMAADASQDELSSEELSGLTAICRLLMKEAAGYLVQA